MENKQPQPQRDQSNHQLPPIVLRRGEQISIYRRKHWIALAASSWSFLVFFSLTLVLGVFYWFIGSTILLFPLLLIGTGTLVLAAWLYSNWRNDHYIVTNQRVIHIERVFPVYEGRFEASLDKVQDVMIIQPGLMGRLLDYSDVIIETAGPIGRIVFKGVLDAPKIREEILKGREIFREIPPEKRERGRTEEALVPAERLGHWRKHFAILIRDLIRPFLFALLPPFLSFLLGWFVPNMNGVYLLLASVIPVGILVITRFPSFAKRTSEEFGGGSNLFVITFASALLSIAFILLIPAFVFIIIGRLMEASISLICAYYIVMLLWMAWKFVDWRNDEYILMFDRVLDIKRIPLIHSRRREAMLMRIQNVTHEKRGWGNIFDFGQVRIETAGETPIEFENVPRPEDIRAIILNQSRLVEQEELWQVREAIQTDLRDWYESLRRL